LPGILTASQFRFEETMRLADRMSLLRDTARAGLVCTACILMAVSLAACTVPAEHAALRDAGLPAPIPAHRFASPLGTDSDYVLSPDGRKLSWIGRSWGRAAVFVRDNATGELRSYRAPAGVRRWTPKGRFLVIQTPDTTGKENSHVFAIDSDDASAKAIDLTPYPGVRALIQSIPEGPSDRVLLMHNLRDRRVFDLYSIDLVTRKETLVARNPGDAVSVITDRIGRFNGWVRSREAERPEQIRQTPLSVRQPGLMQAIQGTFRVLGRDADNVYAASDRRRAHVALVAAHPSLGWERVLFEDPRVDISQVVMSNVTGRPLLAGAEPGYPRFKILDQALQRDLDPLLSEQGHAEFGIRILSADTREENLIVSIDLSTAARVYLVERTKGRHSLLSGPAPETTAGPEPVRPVEITARDGLLLNGYLSVPRGLEARRLPMVLVVHGGPWLRSHWTGADNPIPTEFLVSRGYAVLDVNFRGSAGYGQKFLMAGVGEFAGKMQDDLIDAVHWAVERGIADPKHVAIIGSSYGGYAALVGLTATPDEFACGISISGPTDLASLIEKFPPYWQVDLAMWHDFVGNPGVEKDRLDMTSRSPLAHAGALRHPVLIVQGAQDIRVRPDQAEGMVAALRRTGQPVQYLRIEDMGHDVGWWVHKLEVMRRSEVFLHECLGGQASRFDPLDPVAWAWSRISP
jgi:dipeptidyl aminopeptidase/acylaminoacyl peptidase